MGSPVLRRLQYAGTGRFENHCLSRCMVSGLALTDKVRAFINFFLGCRPAICLVGSLDVEGETGALPARVGWVGRAPSSPTLRYS